MTLEDVKWLQVENSTKCNAWCPACPRNQSGFELAEDLIIEDLDSARFLQVIEKLPNVECIQFCATHGDAVAAANIDEHIEIALSTKAKIQIHTHGGIRNCDWWIDLAKKLHARDHEVWFAIDGLAGIHEIYRQGANFNKTIENAKAFIAAGGQAVWQFIPWQHNEHQIKDCMRLSQQLGFKRFKFVFTVRENLEGRHWRTGEKIQFRPWSRSGQTNPNHKSGVEKTLKVSDCLHVMKKSIYLNANGKISPCCYLNHRRMLDEDVLPDLVGEILTSPDEKCLNVCGNGIKRLHQI